MPIALPAGVTVSVSDNVATVKGPLGTLTQYVDPAITLQQEGTALSVRRSSELKEVKSKHGLYRSLVANMVQGVTKGFEKSLIVNGVGYKAQKQGNKIIFNIGYSHPIEFPEPKGITIDCAANNEVVVKGISKEEVGQTAANIRSLRIPDPYHLYGIRYKNEIIQKKEGKTAGK
jgi:large subunit ribosomal protein L6